MAQEPLSLRAYARHRKAAGLPGGNLQSVQRAVRAERISVTPDGRVTDPEAADREWAANTDLSRAPGYLGAKSSLSESSAREKHWKAELAQLNYLERAGELVNAATVQAEFAETFTTVRNKLLGIPSRMKQAYAGLSIEQLATLEQFIREALEELARR